MAQETVKVPQICRGCEGEGKLYASVDGWMKKLITCKICNGCGVEAVEVNREEVLRRDKEWAYDKVQSALCEIEDNNDVKGPFVAWFSSDVGKYLGFSDEELDKMVFDMED